MDIRTLPEEQRDLLRYIYNRAASGADFYYVAEGADSGKIAARLVEWGLLEYLPEKDSAYAGDMFRAVRITSTGLLLVRDG